MNDFNRPSPMQRPIIVVSVAVGYFLLAAGSVLFTRFEGGTAFIWTASALLLGAVLASKERDRNLLFIACGFASFLATWLFSLGLVAGILLAFINIAEVWVAIRILDRAKSNIGNLGTIEDVAWVLGAAAIAGPIATAIPGALVITAFSSAGFLENAFAWATGHMLGMFIFAPVAVLIVKGGMFDKIRKARAPERLRGLLLVALLASICFAVFSNDALPLLFLPIPFIVLQTFVLGRIGAVSGLVILTGFAASFSIAGHGPIGALALPASEKALILKLYLASASLTALPIAAELARRASEFVDMRSEAAIYSLALQCSSDLILENDTKGRIRLASSSSDTILGIPSDILVGGDIFDLVHPDDAGIVRDAFRAIKTSPSKAIHMQIRLRGHEKHWRWYQCHSRRLTEENGRRPGAISVLRGIEKPDEQGGQAEQGKAA
ncbi:MASE1 domain-containing protein [Qipengyuania nanhaisediminis]|uniref:MASE1 domain-containing protein n=1 Tax=Qipengyuania nanhaisediminis TaxID=604088 RepID=UPI0038B24D05